MTTDMHEIIVTDAVYDSDDIPEIDHLATRAALMRPEIQADGRVKLAPAEDTSGDELPPEMERCDDTVAPYRSVGRLAVHWSSADKAVHGSAQLIAPNLVLTAGHCVHWAGQWNTDLYFLDSRTTPDTVAHQIAEAWGVPVISRDVFLDHIRTPAAVAAEFRRALAIARREGEAVIIAHPNALSVSYLEGALSSLPADIELVRVSELLDPAL